MRSKAMVEPFRMEGSTRLKKTREIENPNMYVHALEHEVPKWALSEERAVVHKGRWRQDVFQAPANAPLDLEIGTGNGFHFAHYAQTNPQRCFLGIEMKFKPLIQAIKRALRTGATNARMVRFHAFDIENLFSENEIDNIFIHFPDPWFKPKKPENRVVNLPNLELFYKLQKPGSFLDFKTDSRPYFLWAMTEIKKSPYTIEFETLDLHKSEMAAANFVTAFESLFLKKGFEINFVRLRKN